MSARDLPPPVRAKLNKLMLMLGSPNEGESANAAALITGLLKAHGLDWHDLVGSIGEAARSAPPPPPIKSAPGSEVLTLSVEQLRALAHRILRSPINTRARRFLAGLCDHADIYGEVKLSAQQRLWLMDLAKRAGAV